MRMKNKSISVIIPVYNEEKYIGKCLSSLAKQSLLPLEIIVIDDGSTDDSFQVVKKLQPTIDNLILIKQRHQGPAKARNLGVNNSKGDILVFVDADMRLAKQYLKNLVKPIIKGKAIATFTKEEYVANPKNIWSHCWSINSYLPLNLHIDPSIPLLANNFRAIKKNIFLKTKGYKSIGYKDDISVLAQLPGIKAKVAQGAICYHFNPSDLKEVFFSARWMGRGEKTFSLRMLAMLSIFNSLRRGCIEAVRHKIPAFILFKIIFDFGFLIGMIQKKVLHTHVK